MLLISLTPIRRKLRNLLQLQLVDFYDCSRTSLVFSDHLTAASTNLTLRRYTGVHQLLLYR